MKILKFVLKTLQIALIAVLSLILAANLYLLLARSITGNPNPTVFGYHWAIVLSGSMEPEISIDDLVISKAQDSYEVRDIVTFSTGSSLTTHRIVEVEIAEDGTTQWLTQGDANNTADRTPLTQDQILGKVVFTIPNLGKAVYFLKTPLGMALLVLFTFGLVAVPNLFQRNRRDDL